MFALLAQTWHKLNNSMLSKRGMTEGALHACRSLAHIIMECMVPW